ncbi:uncharacterized protein LOC107265920 [Cephus cinctus]|uniref:Uncharacterized protein LOC107265920 n=1 Tax=Cephus cinctus TaxID=211228 RepID=A0AAJ7BQB4_CEPCN|nr:uncharacterized protein LOC107265920 [Cephus cinctus]XP_024938954.1 uncharacterized protein LOC107265920 [Cephus cinctus]
MPKLADRLLKDIRWLPLWSCILRDQYGYGRVPASSAPSESDFNYVKTHFLKKPKPIRADEFLELQIANINGRMHIADAKTVDVSSEYHSVVDTSIGNIIEQEEDESNDAISPSVDIIDSSIKDTSNKSEDKETEYNIIEMKSKTIVCELCEVVTKAKSDGNVESRDLCEVCIKIDVDRIFASREEEDWRGKTSQDTSSTETRKIFLKNELNKTR